MDNMIQLNTKSNPELSDYIAQKEVGDKCPLSLGGIDVGSFQITDISDDNVRGSVSSEKVPAHKPAMHGEDKDSQQPVMMVIAKKKPSRSTAPAMAY